MTLAHELDDAYERMYDARKAFPGGLEPQGFHHPGDDAGIDTVPQGLENGFIVGVVDFDAALAGFAHQLLDVRANLSPGLIERGHLRPGRGLALLRNLILELVAD